MLIPVFAAAPAAAGAAPAAHSYIVRYKSVSSVNSVTDTLQRRVGFQTRFRYHAAIQGFAADLTPGQVSALRANPAVAAVEPDGTSHIFSEVPLNPGELSLVGALGVDWTDAGRRIESIEPGPTGTDGLFVRQPSTVAVAVIDTGADLTHPDLASATLGTDCVTPATPTAADGNGHGTVVTGEIAAANQGAGIAGVAPGTKVYVVRVFDATGQGSDSQVLCGMDWVAAHAAADNIKVVNMSFGGSDANPPSNCSDAQTGTEHAAICGMVAAGVTPVAAAGNSSADFAGIEPGEFPEVLTVTAMADNDGKPGGLGPAKCGPDDVAASFSNYATTAAEETHTIAAPGVCILSDAPPGPQGTATHPNYEALSGTSQAAPLVAGAVALCLGEGGAPGPCSGLTPAQIVQKMIADAAAHAAADPGYGFTGDPQHPITGQYYGNLLWVTDLPPVVSFTSAKQGIAGHRMLFTGTANDPDGAIANTTWNFGDGSTANGLSASHVFARAGSYPVKLTATDDNGVTKVTSVNVQIKFATTTTLTASPNPSAPGRPVTYAARVLPVPNSGRVSFTDGGAAIAGCTAVAVSPPSGMASCMKTYPRAGSHSIEASYAGAQAFSASRSSPLAERVAANVVLSTTVGDLRVKVTVPPSPPALSPGGKLKVALSSAHLKSGARERFLTASLYLDRGVKARHHDRVTFGANAVVKNLPVTVGLPLQGLTAGSHKLTVKVVFAGGRDRTSRVLTADFTVSAGTAELSPVVRWLTQDLIDPSDVLVRALRGSWPSGAWPSPNSA